VECVVRTNGNAPSAFFPPLDVLYFFEDCLLAVAVGFGDFFNVYPHTGEARFEMVGVEVVPVGGYGKVLLGEEGECVGSYFVGVVVVVVGGGGLVVVLWMVWIVVVVLLVFGCGFGEEEAPGGCVVLVRFEIEAFVETVWHHWQRPLDYG